MKIVFSNRPGNKRKFLFGIDSADAIKELATLFNVSFDRLMRGDITLTLPDKNILATLNIKSVELKNILTDYAGEEIYIYPEIDKLTISDETLLIS
ncbi:MAG: hypothetical protein Q8L88_00550 [Bacteroidota bacterium]|nr:hypothetical protein [Bacteroidota bacterium]